MSKERPAHILKFFSYAGMPAPLQDMCAGLYALADEMDTTLPECAEKSAGLRKLLEARDCFIRAAVEKSDG